MNEPELLKVETENVTSENVHQSVFYPANEEKLPLLAGLLRRFEAGRIMVFTNTRAAADLVERTLNANGFHSAAISGRVPQKKRQTLLRRFHDGEIPILVATDVAARGLHIPDVSHIINFDLPQDAPDYVHRIGRTARLGARGEAISFACENYAFHLPEIEEFIGYQIPVEQANDVEMPELKRAFPQRNDLIAEGAGIIVRPGAMERVVASEAARGQAVAVLRRRVAGIPAGAGGTASPVQ